MIFRKKSKQFENSNYSFSASICPIIMADTALESWGWELFIKLNFMIPCPTRPHLGSTLWVIEEGF